MLCSLFLRLRPLSPPPEPNLTPPTGTTPPPISHSPTATNDSSNSSGTPLPLPTSTTVTSSDSPLPAPSPSPEVQQITTSQQEVGGSLQSIPEDLEDEEKKGEESTDGPVRTAAVRRRYQHDTLSRLQSEEHSLFAPFKISLSLLSVSRGRVSSYSDDVPSQPSQAQERDREGRLWLGM